VIADKIKDTEKDKERRVTEEKVRTSVKQWEQAFSGFPINCRRVVDLFAEDGIYFYIIYER